MGTLRSGNFESDKAGLIGSEGEGLVNFQIGIDEGKLKGLVGDGFVVGDRAVVAFGEERENGGDKPD